MVGPGHDGDAAHPFNRRNHLRSVGRHNHRADARFLRSPPNMDDHRLAANVGQRLSRQAGRGHAGRNKDDGIGHFFSFDEEDAFLGAE